MARAANRLKIPERGGIFRRFSCSTNLEIFPSVFMSTYESELALITCDTARLLGDPYCPSCAQCADLESHGYISIYDIT